MRKFISKEDSCHLSPVCSGLYLTIRQQVIMRMRRTIFFASIALILLSVAVTIPLTIRTIREGGGSWGFGVIGLPILLPLSAYILFGIAGALPKDQPQWKAFLLAHIITLLIGFVTLALIPIYPGVFALVPLTLFILGLLHKKRFRFYLLLMITLALVANILLLKWELDFHRGLPIVDLLMISN